MQTDRVVVDERVGVELSEGRCGSGIYALGLVGITEDATDAIYRFRQGLDPKEYASALKAVMAISMALDRDRNWRYRRHETLAAAVLQWWTCPTCPSCCGARTDAEHMGPTAKRITGTPSLEADACPDCHGSGQRPFPWGRGGRESGYHTETLFALQEAERRIRGKLIDRLAHQIRDSGALG